MDPASINWLAVGVAAVSSFLVGGLWYSPLLFGNLWARLCGFSPDELARGMAKIFIGSFVCSAIAAANLAFFIGKGSVAFGTFAGAAAGIGWVATGVVTTHLFERRPGLLIAIDAGYHAVAMTLMGVILGAWH